MKAINLSLTLIILALAPLARAEEVPEGLSTSDWQSIRAAYEAGRHAFTPTETGWTARNPGQRWTTEFDGRGFLATPDEGDWTWGLKLLSYGAGEAQIPVSGTPSITAEEQRLAYRWDDKLEEWWINDRRGLEHGYIVAERPSNDGASDAPLTFHLGTRGGLKPRVSTDARDLIFEDTEEQAVLNYAGLKVWDAEGRILASRFEEDEGATVRLVVNDRGAVYPVTVDPIAQQAYLKAGNTDEGDYFGWSVAISGDTAVVGALFEASNATGVINGPGGSADNTASRAGAAYVFVRKGTAWSQRAYLKAGNTDADNRFGNSVAISGDTVIVGAPDESSNVTGVTTGPGGSADKSARGAGAAYVFLVPEIPPAPPSLSVARPRAFPATRVGRRTKPQTIRVTNIGGTPATGLTASLSGKAAKDFRLTRPADTLAPGAATSFRATFRARAKGLRKATATVSASNAAATSVPLKGRGK